ncbi:MAG: DinB-like domain protein [Acidobacteria bacterium]|nr:DinB-like domain protein [Acidobacteriota bacterium]
MTKTPLLLAALVVAAPAIAQESKAAAPMGAVETLRRNFVYVGQMVTRSAEQMPEADYAFKPTPEVRSFGQLIGHVADANQMFCALIIGEANPSSGSAEKKTAKADLVAAVKASYEYCGRAYALADADTASTIKLFGQDWTRLSGLVLNNGHNWEHYGNIVTYLRLKGQVPPSSQERE